MKSGIILEKIFFRTDGNSKNLQGGYVFFETSTLPHTVEGDNTVSAMIQSPQLTSTGIKVRVNQI